MAFDVKQAIIDRLRATKRDGIETVIDYMSKHGFFAYHCYHHHRYDGGLASHAWQTYQVALRLNAERCAQNAHAQTLDTDSIAIAALLHDVCNCSGMRDIKGHGRRSAKLLKELGFKLSQEEFLAVRFHMGLSKKKSHPLYEDAKRCELSRLIHKADSISASLQKGYSLPSDKLA